MKKLSKLSLHQLDKAELGKRQEGLLFGGGTPGLCRCGSCAPVGIATQDANSDANHASGYTISGSNPNADCTCPGGQVYSAMSTKPGF